VTGAPPSRDAVTATIRRIWCDVLEREDVAGDAHFFEAGGESLQATRVIARIWEAFDVELTFEDLLDAPRLDQLGRAVADRLDRGAPATARTAPVYAEGRS
jgi:acyl carrier protein